MFNILKKQPQPKEVLVADYPEIIHQIHNEFMCAGEQILKDAERIIADCKLKNMDKGKQLMQLGFINTPQAKEVIETGRKEALAQQNAVLVQYYWKNYPLNKFITESAVEHICKKYGLVCGDVSLYKGFVPEKKLKEIASFSIKDTDKPFAQLLGTDRKFLTNIERSECKHDYWGIEKGSSATFSRGNSTSLEFSERINSYFDTNDFLHVQGYVPSLKICAPLKDMDVQGYDLKGYRLEKQIKDPVVLQPVNGGYLIVTAWGDEASDENIVNERNN